MMMFYRRRALPKHRYDMIKVDYSGRGHRTRLRDLEINCCVYGVPLAMYIKEWRRRGPAKRRRRAQGGAILVQVGFAPLSYSNLEKGEGGGGEKEGEGGPPPLPFPNSDWGKGGCTPPLGLPLSFLSTKAHKAQ